VRERNKLKPWEDYGMWMFYPCVDLDDCYVYEFSGDTPYGHGDIVYDTREEAIEALKEYVRGRCEKILKFEWLK